MASALANFEAHFIPYLPCFRRRTRSVEGAARQYLHGLYQCQRRNMEKMTERVVGTHYQRLQHMLSGSAWERTGVRHQLIADANTCFGYSSALVIDESGFGKKGSMSAGVDRQWNGRLGKVENSQVGVFAAVTRDRISAVVDGELFVPEGWFADPERCEEAGIPDTLKFRSKGEMAFDMVQRLRREGLQFAWVVVDGGYGHLPWLLLALEDEGETFLAEVHSDQNVYLSDPGPTVPARRSLKGRAPRSLQAAQPPMTVTAWAATQPASAWRRLSVREGDDQLFKVFHHRSSFCRNTL